MYYSSHRVQNPFLWKLNHWRSFKNRECNLPLLTNSNKKQTNKKKILDLIGRLTIWTKCFVIRYIYIILIFKLSYNKKGTKERKYVTSCCHLFWIRKYSENSRYRIQIFSFVEWTDYFFIDIDRLVLWSWKINTIINALSVVQRPPEITSSFQFQRNGYLALWPKYDDNTLEAQIVAIRYM